MNSINKNSTPKNDKQRLSSSDKHKRAIAQQYSSEWEYWKNVYNFKEIPFKEEFDVSYAHRRDIILRLVDSFANKRLLRIIDVGCGAGILVTDLIQRGHSVVGVDISAKMVEEAQKAADKHFPGKAICCIGDIESLPFGDGSFNIVIAAGVLSHQLEDLLSIRELKRIARSDGIAIITLPNRLKLRYLLDPYYYYLALIRIFRKLIFRNKWDKTSAGFTLFMKNNSVAVRKYYYGQLNRLFRKNGLHAIRTISCGFGPLTFFGKNILTTDRWTKFSVCLEALSTIKIFSFLNYFATFWVIQLSHVTTGDKDIT